jgi:hypothetical protein
MHAVVEARLIAACPVLTGRVGTALQLADAMARNALPQITPAAFILPLGLRGGAANAAAGLYRQAIDRFLGVVLVVRSAADPLGQMVVDELAPLIDGTIAAIAGWAPDEAIGVYRLTRGELVSLAGGVATYQLDFALDDQLRIAR